jgi:hypothetical protein
MSETERTYGANYGKPPAHTRFKKGQSGNPRGRPAKTLATLLTAALSEPMTITENGKRRRVSKREAVIAQLVNKSASADLRATKMLIDMMKSIEKKAEPKPEPQPAPTETVAFSSADEEVIAQLIARLRRDICSSCPWAEQRADRDSGADNREAEMSIKS